MNSKEGRVSARQTQREEMDGCNRDGILMQNGSSVTTELSKKPRNSLSLCLMFRRGFGWGYEEEAGLR